MKFMNFETGGRTGLAVEIDGRWRGRFEGQVGHPGSLEEALGEGLALRELADTLAGGESLNDGTVTVLPPLQRPPKILCVGLNYRDHSEESNFEQPDYPTLFTRFWSTLIGHDQAIRRPPMSEQLDYEGEIVAIIGKHGKNIPKNKALDYVVGWSLFNDASIRDYQFRTPQWTVGKNFDASGSFGPWLVTADEIPAGARDLILETRLNGKVVQHASTNDMIFDTATLIATISEVMTLEPGDLIVTGTPAGVGFARTPPLWMKNGDVVEVAVQGLGVLRNPVVDG